MDNGQGAPAGNLGRDSPRSFFRESADLQPLALLHVPLEGTSCPETNPATTGIDHPDAPPTAFQTACRTPLPRTPSRRENPHPRRSPRPPLDSAAGPQRADQPLPLRFRPRRFHHGPTRPGNPATPADTRHGSERDRTSKNAQGPDKRAMRTTDAPSPETLPSRRVPPRTRALQRQRCTQPRQVEVPT